jgi:CheY-like chemotaxis protein
MAKTILHVEDDRTIILVVKAILEKHGYRMVQALDAMQGMMQARTSQPALIILDVMMPAGGGASVAERLRTLNTTMSIPILVYSSAPRSELEGKIPFGPDCLYIQKPAPAAELLKAVESLIGPA